MFVFLFENFFHVTGFVFDTSKEICMELFLYGMHVKKSKCTGYFSVFLGFSALVTRFAIDSVIEFDISF